MMKIEEKFMKKIENTVVAQIPLKNEGGLLVYIENILNDLRKKEIYPSAI